MKRFTLLIICLLFIASGCAGLQRDPTAGYSVHQLRQMGEKFLGARDYGQALRFLSLAEKRQPNDPVIQYDLGLAYYERGLKSEALVHLKKALALKPDYPEADNALGRYYAEENQLDQALFSFEKAARNPFYQTPQVSLFNMGLIYEKKGDSEMALKQYQEAVRLQNNYGMAHFRRGLILEQQNRADEAREAYAKAIEYAPDLVEAHYRFGVMSYTAGELENALYSLNRVVKLAPRSSMAEDSRRYLERLQTIIPSGQATQTVKVTPAERLSRLDVLTNKDLTNDQLETDSARVSVSTVPDTAYQKEAKAVVDSQPSVPEPEQQEPQETSLSNEPRTYTVQMGSFLDKENAEDLQQQLQQKGYEAVVKPFRHQVLGQLYVVQLKPLTDPEKASQLMMQIEKEGYGKTIIIEAPSN
jgi:tetratricopeptide (TPR) repeat protein